MSKRNDKKEFQNDKEKLIMAGLTIIMSGTLFIYFLWSIMYKKYLVHFSIDAIVGVIALMLLIKNLIIKHKTIFKYTISKDFLLLDISSLLLCVLIKISLSIQFDFSLIILVVSYYIFKKRFEKI